MAQSHREEMWEAMASLAEEFQQKKGYARPWLQVSGDEFLKEGAGCKECLVRALATIPGLVWDGARYFTNSTAAHYAASAIWGGMRAR